MVVHEIRDVSDITACRRFFSFSFHHLSRYTKKVAARNRAAAQLSSPQANDCMLKLKQSVYTEYEPI